MGRPKKQKVVESEAVKETMEEVKSAPEPITQDNALKVIADCLFVVTNLMRHQVESEDKRVKVFNDNLAAVANAHNQLNEKVKSLEKSLVTLQNMLVKPVTTQAVVTRPPAPKITESPQPMAASTPNGVVSDNAFGI